MKRFLLISLLFAPPPAYSAEIRPLPWQITYRDKQAAIVDAFAWLSTKSDLGKGQLILPDQTRLDLPYFPTWEQFQAGYPLLGAVLWQQTSPKGTVWQVHIRTCSADLIRQLRIEVQTDSELVSAQWQNAAQGNVLQVKQHQAARWEHLLINGQFRTEPGTSAFLLSPPTLFSWHTHVPLVPANAIPPTNCIKTDQAVFVVPPMDQDNLVWSLLRFWGFYPDLVWDLALVTNPSWRQVLFGALPQEPSLGSFYRALGALAPSSHLLFLSSPEALSWWVQTDHIPTIRRQILAGCWLASGYNLPPVKREVAVEGKWADIISGQQLHSQQALSVVLREVASLSPGELLPMQMSRQGEVYTMTFRQLSNPDATYLWADFWTPDSYKSTHPEETIEIVLGTRRLTEALTNLPWFGPLSTER